MAPELQSSARSRAAARDAGNVLLPVLLGAHAASYLVDGLITTPKLSTIVFVAISGGPI